MIESLVCFVLFCWSSSLRVDFNFYAWDVVRNVFKFTFIF